MHFDLKRPCHNCPFRREGHIPLTAARVREISGMMLSSQGGTFGCHATTVTRGEDQVCTPETRHCAGALIYAEKQGTTTQAMRIAERLGLYDHAALMENAATVDLVFDSQRDMLRAHARVGRRRKGRT